MASFTYRFLTLTSVITAVFLCVCAGRAQQFTVGGLVPVSELGTATLISKPALTPQGGQLIFSDSPEELKTTTVLPGAMYRDQVGGRFRIFYHHENETSAILTVGVALTNASSQPELLFSRGQGQGLSIYPDVAGQTALSEFISSHRRVAFLAVLPPGQTYWSLQDVPQDETASAILEYAAVTVPGVEAPDSLPLELFQDLQPHPFSAKNQNDGVSLPDGFGLGAVTVTTAAYSGAQPSDPAALPIIPPGNNTRGTFPHFDRFGAFSVAASGGLQALPVDSNHASASAMPGEYEPGVDAVDGDTQVYDNGNYGVLYNFRITIQNSLPPQPLPFALLMQPSGGSGHYVMLANSDLELSPYVNYQSAWWFHQLTVRGFLEFVDLQTGLTGGSSGPQKLLFDPGFTGE